ncbi:MAG: phenylphosphate carboxylase subunit delta [Pedosphaera sp.]|nr:phenylphosphate carboxylase subunit delta [Pedosphaera sp.]
MSSKVTKALNARFAKVKLFLCDVDGILTDASVFIGQEQETKRFHIRDGLGLITLRKEGVKIGWISNRPSAATTRRAEELKIDFLEQGKGSKVLAVQNILASTGLNWEEVCYMGDDIVDLGVLRRVGVAATVADAITEAKAAAHYVTELSGGHGAVREVIELILKAQGRWDRLVAEHSA